MLRRDRWHPVHDLIRVNAFDRRCSVAPGCPPLFMAPGGTTPRTSNTDALWPPDALRRAGVIDFWIAFSNVVITVRRLIRQAWTHYRWDDRLCRRPQASLKCFSKPRRIRGISKASGLLRGNKALA